MILILYKNPLVLFGILAGPFDKQTNAQTVQLFKQIDKIRDLFKVKLQLNLIMKERKRERERERERER